MKKRQNSGIEPIEPEDTDEEGFDPCGWAEHTRPGVLLVPATEHSTPKGPSEAFLAAKRLFAERTSGQG